MPDQFNSLFERARPYVERIAKRLVRDHLAAGDAVGDVENNMWTLVLPRLRSYDSRRGSDAHFVVVVIGSARRRLLQQYRRLREKRCTSIDRIAPRRNGNKPKELADQIADGREQRGRQARMRIDAALDGAPRHLMEVLHAMEGGSVRAAAKCAKLSRKKAGYAVDAIRLRLSG